MSGFRRGSINAVRIQGTPVATTAPTPSQVEQFGGSNWAPATIASGPINATSLQGVPVSATPPVTSDILQASGGNWGLIPAPTGGSVLASAFYDPAVADGTTSNTTTFAALGSGILRATFVAPPSGTVWVYFGGFMNNSNAVGGGSACLGVLEGSTVLGFVPTGPGGSGAFPGGWPMLGQLKITGLIPGSTHHYDLAIASASPGVVVNWHAGGGDNFNGFGPSFVEVWG